MTNENPMKEIKLEKVVLNIGAGGPGEKLEKAKNLLESLTGRKTKITKARGRSAFGVSKGRDIGAMVTLRENEAERFLERVFEAKENRISRDVFDQQGNLSLGIKEHIDLPGTDYDPEVGIFGMDVAVKLERPGFRIKKKKVSKEIGKDHKISKDEAISFIQKNFDVEVVGD
ncbi:MAG: 50S ribosomal protein L5 [Candidatus Aenigmatarchaeota archaeon]